MTGNINTSKQTTTTTKKNNKKIQTDQTYKHKKQR